MNTGIIASVYAKALLRYSLEGGFGAELACQLTEIQQYFYKNPDVLHKLLKIRYEPQISIVMDMVRHSFKSGEEVQPQLVLFLRLLIRRERISYFPFIVQSFLKRYYAYEKIVLVSLKTASSASSAYLKNEIERLLSKNMHSERVLIKQEVSSELLGGFVLTINDTRIDASVSSRLKEIKQKLIAKNRRIV